MVDTTTARGFSSTPPQPADGRVKGTKLGAKLKFLRETLGADMAERVVSSMDTEDQSALRTIYDVGWYPIELYQRVLEAIVQVAADGDEGILDDIGHHSAEKVAASYPAYYRSRQPLPLLEKMVPLHSQLNDPGEMEILETAPTEVAIVVRAPVSVPMMCRVARAFYRRTLELCSVKEARVKEPICSGRGGEHCRFDLSWT